jgi:hypothetical protein
MKRTLGILGVTLALASCATITRGTDEMYAIETDPPGAIATLSNGMVCKTPCSFRVKRKSSFRVDIVKPGYEDYTTTVSSALDGAGHTGFAGNVILGGIIGAGVDAGSGAMHSHQPNPLVVTLIPHPSESAQEDPASQQDLETEIQQ